MPKPVLYPVKKLLAISTETAEAIASYRFENRIPSEIEAIRRLIGIGLSAAPTVLEQPPT